ncbi:pilus assembly PilX N-terminal domain-containing protein [Patescibacteria group bacterium]
MQNKNKKQGSVLVYTLFIMFLALIMAVGIIISSVSETSSTLATKNSTAAFQVADSGMEFVNQAIKENAGAVASVGDLCDLSSFVDACDSSGDDAVCESAVSDMDFIVEFFDGETDSDIMECGDDVSDILRVKSTGTYKETSRAVEVKLGELPTP